MASRTLRPKSAQSPKLRSASGRPRRGVERAVSAPPTVIPEAPATPRLAIGNAIGGQVVEERSGIGLAHVTVRWTLGEPAARAQSRQVELGTAATDENGFFFIEIRTDAQTQAALCLAQHGVGANGKTTFLTLVDESGDVLGQPVEVAADDREITLFAPAGGKVVKAQWQAVADYLVTNRMMQVADLTRQLAAPFADSPVHAWPASTRASALRQ